MTTLVVMGLPHEQGAPAALALAHLAPNSDVLSSCVDISWRCRYMGETLRWIARRKLTLGHIPQLSRVDGTAPYMSFRWESI